MAAAKSYFDTHAHHHAYHTYREDPNFYLLLRNYLTKRIPDRKARIMDVGCGDGSFIVGMIKSGVNADFIGSDFSRSMIDLAQKNLNSHNVELFLGDGLMLPIREEIKFNLIHLSSVLHHLIGITRMRSMNLVRQMLQFLLSKLEENGILIIEDGYYLSYLIPHITSFIIFYGLKFLNFFHLDISRLVSDIQPGLEVNFFSDKELERLIIEAGGSAQLLKKLRTDFPKLYRLFLLKDYGHISYMVTPSSLLSKRNKKD